MENKWRTGKLDGLVTFRTGKLDSNAAVPDGDYPFFTCSQETLRTNTFSFDTECVLLAGNNANGIFPLKYFHGKFDAYQRTYVVKPCETEVLVTKFLYYALRLKLSEFRSFSTGAATKFLTLSILNGTEIQVPPLPVQRRIAGILSAYDELIENSQRRIRILEEMARSLYREWFVHFRFLGHKNVKLVPSHLGNIPRGWEWLELNKLGFLGRGKSRHRPRNEASLYGGPYPFFQTGDIKEARIFLRGNSQTYSEAGLAQSKLWPPGTLCITIAANIAETAILAKTGCFPDSVVGFVPDVEKSDAFCVKMYLDSIKQQMQNISRGTTQDNLSLEKLLSFPVLTPPSYVIGAFRERISPMLEMLELLLQKEENLHRTRDLLLPRLLSGQVELTTKEP